MLLQQLAKFSEVGHSVTTSSDKTFAQDVVIFALIHVTDNAHQRNLKENGQKQWHKLLIGNVLR